MSKWKFKPERDYKYYGEKTMNDVIRSYEMGETVTGMVNDYDLQDECLIVNLGCGIQGKLPFDECCLEPLKYKSDDIPEQVTYLTRKGIVRIKVTHVGEEIYLSRKANLLEFFERFTKSNTRRRIYSSIEGKSKRGAFCDIGEGFIAYCPINEITRIQIDDVSKWLERDKYVKVKIIETDIANKQLRCSIKKAASEDIIVGSNIWVKVGRTITNPDNEITGYFVEVTPAIAGIADVQYEMKNQHRELKQGDRVLAYVRRVMLEEHHAKLYLK